jgi:hypothetical protein
MLNFKYGKFENLPARTSDTNGTIYITTDEKAMYVDLDNQRIRLSQIITLSSHDWQTLPPPYSTEAFYYVSDANALLKYTGSAWIQLNSTKDLTDALSGLGFLGVLASKPSNTSGTKGQICTVGSTNYIYTGSEWVSCGTVGAEILDLATIVGGHTQTIGTHSQAIADLKSKDTAIEGTIDLISKAMGYVGSGADLPKSANEGDIFIHGTTVKVYCKNPATATTASWNALGNDSKRLEDLRARVEVVAAAAGDKSAVEKLTKDLATLQQTVNGITAASLGVGDFKDKTVAGIKTSFTGAVEDGNEGFVTGDATWDAILAAKNALLGQANYTGTIKGAYGEADKAKQAASTAQQTADAITEGASTLTTLKKVEEKFSKLKVADLTDASSLATDTELAAAKTTILGKNADNTDYAGTVKGAYESASSAAQAAGRAQQTADAITTGATTLTTLKKVEEKFAALTVADITDASSLATDSELAAAKTAILGKNADNTNYAGTVKGAYEAAASASGAASTAQQTANAITQGTQTYTNLKKVEDKLKALKVSDITDASSLATDLELAAAKTAVLGTNTDGSNYAGTVKGAYDAAAEAAAAAGRAQQAANDVQDNIVSKMQAADAMQYKGTVASASALPTANVSIGHTYKATAKFKLNTTDIYIGDLLIAKAKDSSVKEDSNGYLPSNGIAWDHVPSGYVADYNPKMTVAGSTNSADINLTSAHSATTGSGDLGDFQISGAANSAITISVASGSNNVTIGMTWGTF